MKTRPIIFNGEMVRAILEGRKTQTRRVIKLAPVWFDEEGNLKNTNYWKGDEHVKGIKWRLGVPGDRLWVRETFVLEQVETVSELPLDARPVKYIKDEYDFDEYWLVPHYRATEPEPHIVPDDLDELDDRTRWSPSIHMPRWASRITLEVKSVRVERVQDISHEDALVEGVDPNAPYNNYGTGSRYRDTFAELWDSINAKRGYSWDSNPWVWVVEFELCNVL